MIDIEGLQYELVHESHGGTQILEPVPEVYSIIGVNEIPQATVAQTESRASSVVRTTGHSSAFRTNRGGSVIR